MKTQSAPGPFPQLEKALDNIRQAQIEGCICIFIDALDEYSGRSEDIARFVQRLAAPMDTPHNQELIIRVCASSRPWTAFTSLLNETPSFTIQDWTKEDIGNLPPIDSKDASETTLALSWKKSPAEQRVFSYGLRSFWTRSGNHSVTENR